MNSSMKQNMYRSQDQVENLSYCAEMNLSEIVIDLRVYETASIVGAAVRERNIRPVSSAIRRAPVAPSAY